MYMARNLLFHCPHVGGVSGPSSGAAAAMGGDLLTPLSAGLEGISLNGSTQPSYQVHVHVCTCTQYISGVRFFLIMRS